MAALPKIVCSAPSIHQRCGWLPRYKQLPLQLGLMTLRGRQICSLGSSYVLFIKLLKRHLTLLHQSCRAPAREPWSCLPARDWLKCSSATPWPTSIAGGPGHAWSQPTGGRLSLSSLFLLHHSGNLMGSLLSSESDHAFSPTQTRFKFFQCWVLLELHSANYSPVKDIPRVGTCHPSLSVTAHSSVLAHDSFSMSIHRLIDISIGTPTLG